MLPAFSVLKGKSLNKHKTNTKSVNDMVTVSLKVALSELEHEHGCCDIPSAIRDRVVTAANTFKASRFELGAALAAYRGSLNGESTWTAVVRAVAESLGVSVSTIWRIQEDFLRVCDTPGTIIAAFKEAKLDLAAPKNKALISKVTELIPKGGNPSATEAKDAFARAKTEMQTTRPRRLGPAAKAKTRIDQSFQYLERLYADVDPATREAELKTLLERLFTHFSIEAD